MSKLLVIGLDAATFDVIGPAAAEGRLPNLARLMENGASGPLRSTPNMNSLSAWTTFMTGRNPGATGIYWFYEHEQGSYNLRFLNGADVHFPRFWEIASAAGQSVGVINVPMTYPARPLNGFLISGLDAPDESSADFTYPPELYQELQREVGGYLIDTNILGYARSGRWTQAIAATQQVIAQRARVAEYLMQKQSWDLFVAVFTALDRVQHTFWVDPAAGNDVFGTAPAASEIVVGFYERLDEVIGRLCALAGDDTTVLVMSDHGAGFNPLGNLYLSTWLESLGLFHRASAGMGDRARNALRALLRRASAMADGLFSKQARRWVLRHLPGGRAGLVGRLHRVPCDWAHTQAYVDYVQPAIWINLRGREPQGIVEPGAEYERLRDRLIEQLTQCRDPKTGARIVKAVRRREEVYQGSRVESAPDLHVEWNYKVIVSGYQYQGEDGRAVTVGKSGDIVERRNISGDHRPEGILILSGPGVRVGQPIQGAQIADLAPTILHLLGQPVPGDMEGRVLSEVFTEESLAQRPIQFQAAREGEQERIEYSAEEAEQVEKRLRGLGYIN